MKILILGGSGNISYHFLKFAIQSGWMITTITRGLKNPLRRKIISNNLREIHIDLKKEVLTEKHFNGNMNFDLVVNFICYNQYDANKQIDLFLGKVTHYIFISTVAGYHKDKQNLPYTENTSFTSLKWDYAKGKREAELEFENAFINKKFPVTIARLGHTYDTILPIAVGPVDWTVPSMILNGDKVIIHDDGKSYWSLMHSQDAASALFEIALNKLLIGEIINVVSEIKTNWYEIMRIFVEKLNPSCEMIAIPSEFINKKIPYLGNGIIYHKMHNEFFDNSKLKNIIPNWKQLITLNNGLNSSIEWFNTDKERQGLNVELKDSLINLVHSYYSEYERK